EFPLLIGLGTVAIFWGTGSRLVEIIAHPITLIVVFLWLFAVILWSAVSVARHADCLAIKWGEPYGTLVLTLSAITIEVVMVSTGQQIFLIVVALFLYAIFLVIQTMRHSGYFMESEHAGVAAGPGHHSLHVQSTAFHAPMLLVYLIVVILLAEKFAIPLDNSM